MNYFYFPWWIHTPLNIITAPWSTLMSPIWIYWDLETIGICMWFDTIEWTIVLIELCWSLFVGILTIPLWILAAIIGGIVAFFITSTNLFAVSVAAGTISAPSLEQ